MTNLWTPIGPSCVYNGQLTDSSSGSAAVSGRCTAIVVDPNDTKIVYVGTATGGVWKTSNAGQTWTPLMDDQPSMTVGALALDPNDSTRLYVATGEGNDAGETLTGIGLMTYKPGVGWKIFGADKLMNSQITRMIVDPRDGANKYRILLATKKGLWESKDDGASWNELVVSVAGASISDIAYDPGPNVAGATVWAAVRGDGVYKKAGAAAFARLTHGGADGLCNAPNIARITIANCKGTPSVLYAVFSDSSDIVLALYRSDDGGTKWAELSRPAKTLDQGNYNLVLGVHPTVPDIVFFGERKLWRSIDGGKNWDDVSGSKGDAHGIHSDQHVIAFGTQGDPLPVWSGNDGGVWLSFDGGKSFFSRNRGLQTFQFYAIALHPDEPNIMIGGAQDNGMQRYEGQAAWTLSAGGDGFFCIIDPQNPKRWYSSYCYRSRGKITAIQRSNKAGAPGSWSYCVDGIEDTFGEKDFPFYVPFVLDPNDHNTIYLGTNRLYISTNGGDEWKPIKTDPAPEQPPWMTGPGSADSITAIAVNPSDSGMIYVGTYNGRVFLLSKQSDLVYSVTEITANPGGFPGTEYISDIVIPKTTPASQKAYIGLGSARLAWAQATDLAAGRIWVTDVTAGSRKWTSLYNNDPKLDLTINGIQIKHTKNAVNALVLDPNNPDTLYMGCNLGVFKHTAAGWDAFGQGLPNVAISDLQFHAKKRILRAATMGRSIWECTVDAPAGGATVDLYIRDNIVDTGRETTPDAAKDPLSGDDITPLTGADVKIDTPFLGIGGFTTPASTVNYDPAGVADFVSFPQFGSDNFRKGVTSRVYAQVVNRGPQKANNVFVRAYYSEKMGSAYPDVPSTFWTSFPNNDGQTGKWKPLGASVKFDTLEPMQPGIARWEYSMPSDVPSDTVGVLVVATCDETKANSAKLPVLDIAKENKQVSLREVGVNMPAAAVIIGILFLVGAASLATYGIVKSKS